MWLILIFTIFSYNCINSATIDEYRLDNKHSPSYYDITITLKDDFLETKKFSATIVITIIANENDATVLRLHRAPEMDLKLVSIDSVEIPLEDITYSKETQLMEIPITSTIPSGDSFKLRILYEAPLYEDMYGFYLSSVDLSDESEQIATTQFQPTYARRAFPCFDEPSFKAVFKLSVKVPDGYHVLSNQLTTKITSGQQSVFDFNETPKMSTYLLAFVVSKFKEYPIESLHLPMSIWVSQDETEDTKWAADISLKIIESLSNDLNEGDEEVPFDQMPWDHLDQVAIPDFAAGAMENWGLVTYRESGLLWNENESTLATKERILRVIAHEFTHSWFGNWLTTKTWDTTWLNEGFAAYFEYHGVTSVSEADQFELEKQFVVNELLPIMETDSHSALPLTSEAVTNDEIEAKFGTITYNKGAAILRMLRYMIGDTFLKQLNKYIGENLEKTVTPHDFLSIFEDINEDSIENLMQNWLEKPGYPVIDVSVTETTSEKTYTINQRQFFYNNETSGIPETETSWYVPIWYQDITSNSNEEPTFLILKPETALIFQVPTNTTLIFNPQRRGYYRVNYDTNLWNEIIDILTTNHELIDDVTRATLIDDAMNLARAGELSYAIALNLLDYLKNEKSYHPWSSAMNSLSYLQKRYHGSEMWTTLSTKINGLMANIWVDYHGFYLNEELTTVQVYLKLLILRWRCLLDNDDCNQEALEQFERITKVGPIDPNLRPIVFCSTLRQSDSENNEDTTNWEFLWNKYLNSTVANEKESILSSLGCTKNKELLRNFLLYSIDTTKVRKMDGITVFKAVLRENPELIDVAIEFLNTEFANIPESYLAKALPLFGDYLRTEESLTEFIKFVAAHWTELKKHRKFADAAVTSAKQNLNWAEMNRGKLDAYFISSGGNVLGVNLGFFVCSFVISINYLFNFY